MWTRTTPLRVVTWPVLQPTASPNERAAASVWASREVSRMTEADVAVNGMLTATIIAAMAMTALRRLMVRSSGSAEWAASRWMRGLYHAIVAGLPRCRWRLLERALPKGGGRRATFTETPRHSTGVADGPTTILRDPSSD